MHLGEPDTRRQQRIVIGIAVFFILLTIIAFHQEVADVLQLGWARLKTLIQVPLSVPDVYLHSEEIIFYNIKAGLLVSFVWILLVSQQAILPVEPFNIKEIFRTAWHLILWMIHQHGQAILIRDGIPNSTKADTKREGPGVILVDYNSAVVLETRIAPPGLSRPLSELLLVISRLFGLSEKPQSPRTRGAGIIFTHPRERIRGSVDLRKQFRMERDVPCYTRDGIEINANVHTTFTLGQNPDVLLVTYEGEPRLDNLRVITFEEKSEGYLRVTGMSNVELDEPDAYEIHQFFRAVKHTNEWLQYPGITPPARSRFSRRNRSRLQPQYDANRVFAAVFAQARNSTQEVVAWSELPVRVACDLYREIFTHINFDQIYNYRLEDRFTHFQLSMYRRKLHVRMRSCGILSYRYVFAKCGQKFEVGHIYHQSALKVTQVFPLKNAKVLRERGIKVIASGFGDPTPVSDLVLTQRLDAWRATWDRDLQVRMAESELRSMKLRSQTHAEALRDLTYSLSTIFENGQYSEEVTAIRIMQALENAATDAKTRQLLPGNTLDMLKHIETMLRPVTTSRQDGNDGGRLPTNGY